MAQKINFAQVVKRINASNARPMSFVDGNTVYLTDGVALLRLQKADYDNMVNGYAIKNKIESSETPKKLFDRFSGEYKSVKGEHTFLHFYYKDSTRTLCFANVDNNVVCVDKRFLDIVSTEKRNDELKFKFIDAKTPIRLSEDAFVCMVNVSEKAFDELRFIFDAPTAKVDTPTESTNTTTDTATAKNKQAKPTQKTTSANVFEVKDGTRQGFYEFYFAERPSAEVLQLLKGFNMHWNRVKACWFGYVNKDDVAKAIMEKVA